MASLGVRTVDEMIGRTDLLEVGAAIEHWKARGVDLTHVLALPRGPRGRAAPPGQAAAAGPRRPPRLDGHRAGRDGDRAAGADDARDGRAQRQPLRRRRAVEPHRRSATAPTGLPEDTIQIEFTGSAGQSFGGWLAPGVSFTLHGDANDYTGKGLSGGVLAVLPPDGVTFRAEDNVIVGNTVLYGATERPRVLPRPRGRALRGPQLGRQRRRRGRRRPRLRVHDRRPRRRARRDRPQLRRGHERRPGLRPRRGRARCAARINPTMLDQLEPLDEGDAIEVRDLVAEHVRAHRLTGRPARARRVGRRCCRTS